MNSHVLTNAIIVTPNDHFNGSVVVENGIITDVVRGKNYKEGIDLRLNWLIPGLIDIHSDYLEKELHPRPSASFPVPFAMHFMDARAAACGITTLFSAISFSQDEGKSRTFDEALNLARMIEHASSDLLINHYIHARLDPNSHATLNYLDDMLSLNNMKIVVYNENIPGQRQFTLDYAIEMRAKNKGVSKEEMRKYLLQVIEERSKINHRQEIYEKFYGLIPLGSHDDTTVYQVVEAKSYGATLSEMPTTIEAARRAKELGMFVCMGAPNYYRGGSHCGNLSCIDAIEENLVDILCSDYHFPTMLACLTKMINDGFQPSFAVNLMTKNAADYLGLTNIGSIEIGKRADLVSFGIKSDYGAVTNVFVNGFKKYSAGYQLKDNHNEIKKLELLNIG